MKNKIAIFASGSGTNALNLIQYFKDHPSIEIKVVACNKEGAGVLDKASSENIPSFVFNRASFKEASFLKKMEEFDVNFIVLAGFLWKVPAYLIEAFPERIVNIHPALLPKFGGKGMYGMNVHQAVYDQKETETGITVHYVNEVYDDGEIILQESFELNGEEPEAIAQKIHQLEYKYFPKAIEKVLL